ncbi:ABC transporter permease [Desertivibrio insolitus]|uniref:ABC transporter permease n=1 Tax=Herbiconiux sp. SYSU D00978 TaxID=2812562 RepID=UPI001A966532|nr:ABC transporter permease [Herbiconiux sp. SYSU D00978]
MLLTLLTRLARSLGVFLLVTIVTFSLMYSNGPGVARATLGLSATEEDVQRRMVELGLDRPLLIQYLDWLGGVFTGNLGNSFFTGEAVTSALANRVPVTLSLTIATVLITIVISVLAGVAAAYYGGWIDRVVQFFASIGAAVPPFIVAVILVFAFAVSTPLFPATGYVRPAESVTGWLTSITLPVIALLVGSIAGGAAQIRGAVLDALSRDFVRTLRARGLSERAVVLRHVLRTASGPGLIAFGLIMIGLLGGALFVELVFALPGIGQLAVLSATAGDVPMVMGGVLSIIVIVLVVNFLADFSNALLNPKARAR